MSKDRKIEYQYLGTGRHGSVDSAFISFEDGDRLAKCYSCPRLSLSRPDLPIFEARPKENKDAYSCGCMGFD